MTSIFKLTDEDKELIQEISTLSGYGQNIVKECFEFLLVDWVISLIQHDGKRALLHIPYLGTLAVRYEGDDVLESGDLITEVSALPALTPAFKKIVGDTHDQGRSEVIQMLEEKIGKHVDVVTSLDKEDEDFFLI